MCIKLRLNILVALTHLSTSFDAFRRHYFLRHFAMSCLRSLAPNCSSKAEWNSGRHNLAAQRILGVCVLCVCIGHGPNLHTSMHKRNARHDSTTSTTTMTTEQRQQKEKNGSRGNCEQSGVANEQMAPRHKTAFSTFHLIRFLRFSTVSRDA